MNRRRQPKRRRRLRVGRLLLLLSVAMVAGLALALPPETLERVLSAQRRPQPALSAARPATVAVMPTRPRAHVTVYNGSDRLGLERLACRRLSALGYRAEPAAEPVVGEIAHTVVVGGSQPTTAARLAGHLSAQSLAAAPGFPPAGETGGLPGVVLIVGRDWPE